MDTPEFTVHSGDILRVRLTPNAHSNCVEGFADWGDVGRVLKVRVKAKPQNGAANAEMLRTLAAHFDLPISKVLLEKGSTSRVKLVKIV